MLQSSSAQSQTAAERRQLHQWLADHVMGWTRALADEDGDELDADCWFDSEADQTYWIGDGAPLAHQPWRPTQSLDDAWLVVDRLIHLFGPFVELATRKGQWECALDLGEWDDGGNWVNQSVRCRADTPTQAICATAKAALERYRV